MSARHARAGRGNQRLLMATELAILCGRNAGPPSGAKTYDWGAGVVYLRPELYPAL